MTNGLQNRFIRFGTVRQNDEINAYLLGIFRISKKCVNEQLWRYDEGKLSEFVRNNPNGINGC